MLLGCLVVELCTLIGLVCMAPCIKSMVEDETKKTQWMSATSAFAAGALLAAAVFLMIPEGARCARALPGTDCLLTDYYYQSAILSVDSVIHCGVLLRRATKSSRFL